MAPALAVVLDGPSPSVKELVVPVYAIRLAQAGVLVLTFDRRHRAAACSAGYHGARRHQRDDLGQGYGRIVTISSVGGRQGVPGVASYSAAKPPAR